MNTRKHRTLHRAARLILAGSILALPPLPSAFAATATWANTGTDFNAGASWIEGTAPGNFFSTNFTGAEVTNPDVSATVGAGVLQFITTDASGYTIASANGSMLILNSTGGVNASNTSGTNTISVALTLAVAPTNSRISTQAAGGTLNITGDISSANATSGDTFFRGAGTVNLSGTNTFNNVGTVTSGGFTLDRGSVTLGITGGTTTVNLGTKGMVAGNDNTNQSSSGTVTVSGGTLNLNGASSVSGAVIIFGSLANSSFNGTGILNVSGGAVNISATSGLVFGNADGNSLGTLNVNSGTITVNKGTIGSTTNTVETRYILLGTDTGKGTINLGNGAGSTGVLATDRIIAADGSSGTGGATTAAFVFNGGTLKALGANSDWLQSTTSSTSNTNAAALTSVTATAASAIDSNGFAVGINKAISGAGGFTIKDSSGSGAGAVTLGGANTYNGATTVNAGTLLVTGTIASSATTVNNAGSKLGGTGTVGDVTLGSGAILQGGDGTAATGALTSGGNVSLTDGSIIKLTLGTGLAHSSLARTGGTWTFDNDQAFTFDVNPGASTGIYDNIITGVTAAQAANVSTWVIDPASGMTGTFSYDGAGGVDLTVNVVPEPGSAALLLGALPLLGVWRWRRGRREGGVME